MHNLFHPTIRVGSMWSKFGARGDSGDVFLFSNLSVLWFSEKPCSSSWMLLMKKIYSLHVCLKEVKNNLFPSDTLIYGISCDGSKNCIIYALVSTWSLIRSEWEHVKRKMHPWVKNAFLQNFTNFIFVTVDCGTLHLVHITFWNKQLVFPQKPFLRRFKVWA